MAKQPKFDPEQAFQLILTQLQAIRAEQERQRTVLDDHGETLSSHTGTLAEILVTVKRLDEERLVEHHRLNRVIEDIKSLQKAR